MSVKSLGSIRGLLRKMLLEHETDETPRPQFPETETDETPRPQFQGEFFGLQGAAGLLADRVAQTR